MENFSLSSMAELKTKKNSGSVSTFLNSIENEEKRKDAKHLAKLLSKVTGHKPTMWGSSIVGYDSYTYTYPTGRSGEWPAIGFSPRKQNISIYIMPGYQDFGPLLKALGPHTTGKSCLYIKRLSDVDEKVLIKILTKGYTDLKKKYPAK